MGPLAGLTVIELAHIMSGPTCGLLLADMGADVIKVEKVPDGDDTRRFTPYHPSGESGAFMIMNRNKRGIAVNLKTEGGKAVLRRLLARADVVTENYRKGTMEKLGLGYESLRGTNPGLIYAEISGYGRTGPLADKPGFDLVAQGMSGVMSVTGEPEGPPTKSGVPVTDINAGILAAVGILAAYIHRLKTGEGQRVDVSLFEAGFQQMYWFAAAWFTSGTVLPRMGSANPTSAPYQAFETRDGWVNIGAANQANYERLLEIVSDPRIADDPRFQTPRGRSENRAELVARLAPHIRRRTTDEWVALLDAAGMPAGPILDVAQAAAHPQTVAREMVVETVHPKAGRVRSIGLPIKLSATPGRVLRPAPLLGEHTREVLLQHGYSDAEIDELARTGAVVAADAAAPSPAPPQAEDG